MRTEYVRALGGWVASPADDDVAMFAALSELAAGYNDPTVTWLYRHHPNQTHRTEKWRTWSSTGRRIALQRAAAVRAVGMSFGSVDPTSDVMGQSPVDIGPLQPKKVYRGQG
jgi:hypothetical protein